MAKKKKVFWFWPTIFSIVIVGFGMVFLSEFVTNSENQKKVLSTSAAETVATPSPSLTATPTPEVYSGFCLQAPTLLYHHIQPASLARENGQSNLSVDSAIFDQQMAYLVSHGYSSLTAGELVNALYSHSSLPAKSVLITLDDGYQDAYDYAFPILRKYGLRANLMIATGLVGNSGYLNWGQVREMKDSGVFSLVNHTWSHYTLTAGPDDKVRSEIKVADQQLADFAGAKTNLFAYPYGAFNNQVIKILQEGNFAAAFSTNPGFWQCDSFIMALRRNRVGNAPLSNYGL